MNYRLVCSFFVILTFNVQAQDFGTIDTTCSSSRLLLEQNYISISSAFSMNSLFQARGRGFGSIISFEYGRNFSDVVGMQIQSSFADIFDDSYIPLTGLMITSLTNSLNATVRPSATAPLVIVAGGIFRWYSSLEENIAFPTINLPRIYYVEALQFGVNAHIEYLFSIDYRINIGLRGQGQIFFEPFFFNSNRTTPATLSFLNPGLTYVLNLGAFLRIGF